MLSELEFLNAATETPYGLDLEWFAADNRGNVAGFCNAGFAAVPRSVFSSFELYHRTLDLVTSLAEIGAAQWIGEQPPKHDTWDTWSKRGLYGFDWNYCLGQPAPSLPYRLLTQPETPINIHDLPDDIADYLKMTELKTIDFCVAQEIHIN